MCVSQKDNDYERLNCIKPFIYRTLSFFGARLIVSLELAKYKVNDWVNMEKEHGWVSNEVLLDSLGLDIDHMNIQIYRIRSEVKKHSSHWGQHLIERRRGETRLCQCQCIIHESQ